MSQDNLLEQQVVQETQVSTAHLRRHQLETHLTLLGWQPSERLGNNEQTPGRRGYVLRNDGVLVKWVDGAAGLDRGAPGYLLNDRWRSCAWAAIPGPQLRRMVDLIPTEQ